MIEPRKGFKFYHADCMEVMKDIPDKYFDLAVVDPPYGIGEDGSKTKGRTFRKDGTARKSIDKRNGKKSIIFNTYKNGNWDNMSPDQSYFDELFRISENQIIWGLNYLSFKQKADSNGLIFWDKVNGNNDFSDGEVAWISKISSVRKFTFMWNGMLQGKNSNEGNTNQGNIKLKENRIHPTQKPKALYKWIYENYCKEGSKVIDTHLGSNSNGIAAYFSKKVIEFVGIDKDPDYFKDGVNRFIKETSDMFNPQEIELL